jgi:hypothetical protein
MRILCLILASDTAPEHVKFQALWRRFMTLNPQVDCYFYKAHPDLSQPTFLADRTLWIRMNDTFDTVYDKTLRAFEHFLPELSNYDFVYRSNLSTLVSFRHMLEFCADLPKTGCCAGVMGGIEANVPQSERNSLHHPYSFPGGNGFLLSPDLVRRMVDDKEPLVHQDDVTIGNALRRWGIPIREFVRPDFSGMNKAWFVNNYDLLQPHERNDSPKKTMFTYRFKSDNRNDDVEMMSSFIRRFYNV